MTPSTLETYEARRNVNRPTCPRCLERAARQLQAQGLKPRDIAQALGINLAAVLQLLRD